TWTASFRNPTSGASPALRFSRTSRPSSPTSPALVSLGAPSDGRTKPTSSASENRADVTATGRCTGTKGRYFVRSRSLSRTSSTVSRGFLNGWVRPLRTNGVPSILTLSPGSTNASTYTGSVDANGTPI